MLNHKPDIHFIDVYKEKYLYDVNSNGIVRISDEIYRFLKEIIDENVDDESIINLYKQLSNESKEDINILEEGGFLSPKNESIIFKHPEENKLQEYYKSNLSMITLQVTQNCNLRCKYCVYSGSYINRTHMNKRMSVETAFKALSFYHEHSYNSNSISIGFYGGEPLLEFDLIKKCVEKAEYLFNGKSIQFHMTSNATLLDVDKIKFLREHEFNLTISLDGPKHIQNKNRIFADGNKGTFDIIMEKLKMVKEVCPEFLNSISFNAVIDLKQDVSCTSEFFMTYDLVKEIGVSGNYVDSNNLKDKDSECVVPEFYAVSNYDVFKVYLSSCTDLLKKNRNSLYSFHIAAIKNQIKERCVYKANNNLYDCPGGQCLPGIQRLFVNVDGLLFPCERVNESSEAMCIGDIYNGFDIDKSKALLNVFKLSEKECKNCWCHKLCELCCGKAEMNGRLDKNKRLSFCEMSKYSVEENIKNYIVLKKYGCREL